MQVQYLLNSFELNLHVHCNTELVSRIPNHLSYRRLTMLKRNRSQI